MKFCWVTLRVENMEKSLEFYQGVLGLTVNSRHGGGETEIVMLGEENMPKVELLCTGGEVSEGRGKGISIGFETPSLDKSLEEMKKRNIRIKGPFFPNPHVGFFFISDPDGYEVQFVENFRN